MANGNGTRSLKIPSQWVQMILTVGGVVIAVSIAWGTMSAKHDHAIEQIREVQSEVKDLREMGERMVRVESAVEHQGKTLDRIDRTLQQLAKPK